MRACVPVEECKSRGPCGQTPSFHKTINHVHHSLADPPPRLHAPAASAGKDGSSATGATLDSELAGILGGHAPIGFTASHTIGGLSAEDRADLEVTVPQRAADGALFFVTPADVEDPLRLEALKATFEAAKAALGGHAPLVVLGRADEVEGKLLAEPLNWSTKKVLSPHPLLACYCPPLTPTHHLSHPTCIPTPTRATTRSPPCASAWPPASGSPGP